MHRPPTLFDFADRLRSVIHRGLGQRHTTRSEQVRARQTSALLRANVDAGSEITCTRTDAAHECCLQIQGVLDTHSAPEIRSVFESVISARRPMVIVDLEHLTRIDSSGVGAIVSLFKRVKAYGGLVIVNGMQNQPLAVCKLLKLDRVFAPASL